MDAIQILLHFEKLFDTETYDHSLRVAYKTQEILDKMDHKYTEEEYESIINGAALHDIGKPFIFARHYTGIYDKIKTEIMSTHPQVGYLIVEPFQNKIITDIVKEHHNKDKTVPSYVKLVQTIDIYDALTHARSYKKAIAPKNALKILASEYPQGEAYFKYLEEDFYESIYR